MITFDHVTKKYRTNIGLEDVSVQINKGDFVFLVGPSGAGKSTFIKLILKEIDADAGTIRVGNFEVTKLSNREIPQFRRKVGTVFQDFRLLPKKTVFENVAFAMEVLHKTPRQIRKQVPQILSLVGISDKAHKYPDELSAGEQQRVAIARAIVNNPAVLIADEPTTALDVTIQSQILKLLKKINERHHTAILFISHDLGVIRSLCDRVIVMNHGTIVESGSVDDVFFHPKEDYTRRLLDAIPNRRTSLRKRIKIAPTAQWPTGSDKKAAPPAEKEK